MASQAQLLADYQAGKITYAAYQSSIATIQRSQELAAKEAALKAATNVSPTLIASELALAHSSAAKAQAEADRRRAQEKAAAEKRAAQKAAQDAQIAAQIAAQAKANQVAKTGDTVTAAALMQSEAVKAQQLADHQAAERAAETAAIIAERDRVAAAEAAVSLIAEAARQEMLDTTGRVRNPEQEGQVLADAIEYVDAYQAYLYGERESPLPDRVIGYTAAPAELPVSAQPYWPGGDQVGEINPQMLADKYVYTPTGSELITGDEVYYPRLPTPQAGDDEPAAEPTPDVYGLPETASLADMFSPARLLIGAVLFAFTGIFFFGEG